MCPEVNARQLHKITQFFSQSPKRVLTYLRHSPPPPPHGARVPKNQFYFITLEQCQTQITEDCTSKLYKTTAKQSILRDIQRPRLFSTAFKACFGPCHLNERTCLEFLSTHTHRHVLFCCPWWPLVLLFRSRSRRKAKSGPRDAPRAFKTKDKSGPRPSRRLVGALNERGHVFPNAGYL
jgi:hypothetical protein